MIAYSQSVITDRKRTQEIELEQQALEIQAKLAALRGNPVVKGNGKEKRKSTGFVNPSNPSEVHYFGKHPQWLKDLLASANGNAKKEQEIKNSIRAK